MCGIHGHMSRVTCINVLTHGTVFFNKVLMQSDQGDLSSMVLF